MVRSSHLGRELDRLRLEDAVADRRFATVDERLIEHRQLGRARDATAARHAYGAVLSRVEVQDCLRRHLAKAARRLHHLPHVADVSDAIVEVSWQTDEQLRQAHRIDDVFSEGVPEVAAPPPLNDLHEYPVGRRSVILELALRLPHQPPV